MFKLLPFKDSSLKRMRLHCHTFPYVLYNSVCSCLWNSHAGFNKSRFLQEIILVLGGWEFGILFIYLFLIPRQNYAALLILSFDTIANHIIVFRKKFLQAKDVKGIPHIMGYLGTVLTEHIFSTLTLLCRYGVERIDVSIFTPDPLGHMGSEALSPGLRWRVHLENEVCSEVLGPFSGRPELCWLFWSASDPGLTNRLLDKRIEREYRGLKDRGCLNGLSVTWTARTHFRCRPECTPHGTVVVWEWWTVPTFGSLHH